MEEKDENGDYLSSYVREINVSGSAFCIYCNKPLVYGNKDQERSTQACYKINRTPAQEEEPFIHHTLTTSLEEAYNQFIK